VTPFAGIVAAAKRRVYDQWLGRHVRLRLDRTGQVADAWPTAAAIPFDRLQIRRGIT